MSNHSSAVEAWNEIIGDTFAGDTMLLAGEPGVGKGRLLARVCGKFAREGRRVLYASSDETREWLGGRFAELGAHENIAILCTTSLEEVEREIRERRPAVVVYDSLHRFTRVGPYAIERERRKAVARRIHELATYGIRVDEPRETRSMGTVLDDTLRNYGKAPTDGEHFAIGVVTTGKSDESLTMSPFGWSFDILATITPDGDPSVRIARLDCVKHRYGESGQSATFDV